MKMLTLTLHLVLIVVCSNAQSTELPMQVLSEPIVPKDNKILLFIGQDSDTITDYVKNVPEDPIEGVTLYTTLKSADPEQALPGVFGVANWNSGDVDFRKTLVESPMADLAIGLAIDTCDGSRHPQNIADKQYDKSLSVFIDYLVTLAPRKVYLRIGYEFDGPWNCYEPQSYKAAFRHIATQLKLKNATNVMTVWQSATWPDPSIAGDRQSIYDFRNPLHLSSWYPGDDVVDWVSLSVFYRDLSQWNYTPAYTPDFAQQRVLKFARSLQKPVMIAEAAPQAYRVAKQTRSFISHNLQTPHKAEWIWKDWYVHFFDFIEQNRDVIRAVAYINANWESQGMWYCADNASPPASNCPQGNWGDSRVHANPFIKQQWLNKISDSKVWLQRENDAASGERVQ